MTLAQFESRFFELKGKLAVGQMDEDEFKREMEKLRFQDSEGRWWMIGAQSGRWYSYDGTRWMLGQPNEPASTSSEPQAAPPPAAAPQPPNTIMPLSGAPRQTASEVPAARSNSALPAPGSIPPLAARQRVHSPTLQERVREEMARMPTIHTPDVRPPPVLERMSPRLTLIAVVVAGLLLVAILWIAVDNLIPGKPVSSFLAGASSVNAIKTPTPRPASSADDSSNVQAVIHVADDLVAQSQFAAALAQYEAAAQLAPNDTDLDTHWSRALALAGRISEAVTFAQRATQLNPNSPEAFAQLARALAWSGQTDAAIRAGETAIKLDAKNVAGHAFLAEAYLRAGRLDDAGKQADAALQLDDGSADAHRAAGWVAVMATDKAKALSEWQRSAQLAGNIYFYHFEFGQVYGTFLNDAASAIPEFQKAIALYPPYAPSYLALGRAYLTQDQPDLALQQFQKALSLDPKSGEAYSGLGQALQKQDHCSQAIPYLQKALELNAGLSEAARGLADCGALDKTKVAPAQPATPGLAAVPTAIVQATIVPVVAITPALKGISTTAGASSIKGRIAFVVFDGQYHLYVANPDGSQKTLITDLGSDPALSVDGSQLLYLSWQRAGRGIHRADAGGGSDQQVSLNPEDAMPSWSPDGTRYVYETRAGDNSDVNKRSYRLRISDPASRPDQDPADLIVGQSPAWGPGGRIVFRDCGLPEQRCGLAIMNDDGSQKRALIDNMNAFAPAWSPDGKLIAFMSDYGGNWDIYIINADGGSPARLTTDPAEDGLPAFSPDGKQIAYLSHSGGVWAIWVMGIDGSKQHKAFDLGGDPAGAVAGNPNGQPGQLWYEQRLAWR